MHDIRTIRENPVGFDAGLARRGLEPMATQLVELDEKRRALITEIQIGQARRNEASKAIGAAKAQKDEATAGALMAEVAALKGRMPALEAEEKAISNQLHARLSALPNLPADDVPDGKDEADNVVALSWGTPRRFDFTPKEHADLGPPLGMDFETGVKLSGARFTFLRGDMARLHRAIAQFMLDEHTQINGYTECNPPVLVNDAAMYGTDKLPKFAGDSYSVLNEFSKLEIELNTAKSLMETLRNQDVFSGQQMRLIGNFIVSKVGAGIDLSPLAEVQRNYQHYFETNRDSFEDFNLKFDKLSNEFTELANRNEGARQWLIPTSEVSLTASVAGEIIENLETPIRLTAHTPCFRSEAGAAGRDTRGLIRQHQFEKVELVSICRPEDSADEHERMTRCAQGILESLGLPYRRILLCTGDMGFGARKTWDLEVWLPGQNAWREISSCSNTGDFQARRMNARYRPEGEKGTRFVHTLNGSGLAVGRTLVAVVENYQQADGSVAVPEVLQPYLRGLNRLEPAASA
jgi:seryl-tRNA synthetase